MTRCRFCGAGGGGCLSSRSSLVSISHRQLSWGAAQGSHIPKFQWFCSFRMGTTVTSCSQLRPPPRLLCHCPQTWGSDPTEQPRTPNHRHSERGQPEAALGGGASGFQPQLRTNTLNASPLLSGPQFTHLKIGDRDSLIFRALPILTVSSAHWPSLTGSSVLTECLL